MNTITFPDGRKVSVDAAGRVDRCKNYEKLDQMYPELFIWDEYDGVLLTDDLDELQSAQELGFEFSDWVMGRGY